MNEEIKEILDRLEIVARKHTIEVCEDGSKIETMSASVMGELRLNNFSAKVLLDYITNLQKENERLKENAEHNDKVVDKAKWNEMIYKSRNEKAIEFNQIVLNSDYVYLQDEIAQKNLIILQGEDKDE